MNRNGLPVKQGLYDPQFEHDACGIGFVANIKGKPSHEIVGQALNVLCNLDHRGGQGSESNTGDGAGILLQIPHGFLNTECAKEGIQLPEPGKYGVGMVFLPQDVTMRAACEKVLEEKIQQAGQQLLGWRTVPTDNSSLGDSAKSAEPFVRQVFIGSTVDGGDELAFERKLYVIRKLTENAVRALDNGDAFYFSSLSSRTIVYKGMLTPEQVDNYYLELKDPAFETALALVHSRFSTNTFPSWERAHPYRYLIHNGEINTLRGNVNWMHARQAMCDTDLFGEDLKSILPIIDTDGSDSQMFDNTLEFLMLTGRSLPHAAMMMVPEPWSKHETMSDEKKAFYEYHSCLMEPWDGPAAISFTDGRMIGAILDRNGLRPARYYVTKDDLIVLASEVGVLNIAPERIVRKERLQPGRMLLVDTVQGSIISDEEVKSSIITEKPYRAWLDEHLISLEQLPEPNEVPQTDHESVLQRQQAFGYTFENLRRIIEPMAKTGVDPIASMGFDAPLAVLSDRPQLLYSYFKQLFAQVTNPPIDANFEEIITAQGTTVGPERNLINPEPESCRQIRLATPILTNAELAKLREIKRDGFKSVTLPILFNASEGPDALEQAMEELYAAADQAISSGATLIILSDRGINANQAAIPALLAVSGLHHHLIREGTRTQVGLLLESGEPREVHHFALLLGYGISGINPYLALETLEDMVLQKKLKDITAEKAIYNYVKASTKGVVKVLAKMGISTIQSYRGAQIFEAVGLDQSVIDKYFTWTYTPVSGIKMDVIAQEAILRHQRAFSEQEGAERALDTGGELQWRKNGEDHLYNPETIHALQGAVRTNNYSMFKNFTKLVNKENEKFAALRSLFSFKSGRAPISIDEVEPVESLFKRFKSGAMSFGSISKETHEDMAIAMNRIGGRSNTGEGGEHPERFTKDENGDSRRSAIKQVASGRFGVTSNYLVNADEIQIKMAQGAKPGEGGQLPGTKVYPWVAEVRGVTPGVGLISPPPHHDIYSIEDLAELIHDLKNANPRARISVKLVSEVGVGTIAAGVAKGKADLVLISGYDGGTGASPQTSIRHAGLPWELGLAETHQTLVLNNLRSRITVETDGKLMTGRDVVIAALLGAEEFGFATTPLIALGCIMMRVCHLDTCPVGVATQNPKLRAKYTGDPEHVVNFMRFVAQDARELMAELGFRTIEEMIGHTEYLETNQAITHWKAKGIDLSPLLHQPEVGEDVGRYCSMEQDHGLDRSLDVTQLLDICKPALENKEHVHAILPIHNVNRVVGTILGSEVTRRYGLEGLPNDTIRIHFNGSAGQSFGAFVPKGITLSLEGDANDYVGKGLSGGKIAIFPSEQSTFEAEDNIIIGNTALYGATDGEVYIRGMAGERFCVRNSGVSVVVEGVGDHGCEYMTGGRVVVLGPTGRNFAAGMSGGIAYVLDENGTFKDKCNKEMVHLEQVEETYEAEELRNMIQHHETFTGSKVADRVLKNWEEHVWKFVKVIPKDYKRMFEAIERVKRSGLSQQEALLVAFEENMKDVSRVGGN
ncbi:glutamate synthase large subunit [Paenibacillus radicis (ex Xue et al. 2023)]|uniref:Glutamate synthase large subunit n=1 Tax=Paenibacillus radicis (ex Xue et al. 2023) TaxID=2972489 RepID=A0ABT1YVA9_9BACL|nr:glutamate synthase large subunit [Paenibacillus radicis (ex Xue et al. 2023)]MCR8636885.1 glutamate synthase large subunit [Paenibacillus radicis (ex Xue et al. 2023)]